jgi:FeS assembly SUF system regulator
MLRISKLTDYGTLVLAQLGAVPNGVASAGQVAEATGIAPPTVSKLLKALARAGLVTSERGPHGGYALARPAADISAAAIIDALDGPVAITECSSPAGACDLEARCRVGRAWQHINRSIRCALEDVSLADLQQLGQSMPVPDLKSGLTAHTG